jgi:hypothetical protein
MFGYLRLLDDPKARAMIDDAIEAMAARKSANLSRIIDTAFVPLSYEQQRHQAILAGEIKPDEPYHAAQTEAEQRGHLSYFLFRYCRKRAEERIEDQKRAEQGLPPIRRPRYTKADHQRRVAETMAALRRLRD